MLQSGLTLKYRAHNTITLSYHESSMNPLSCPGFCYARGGDSVGNWQGWIFNAEQTATLEQWADQRAPISSANSHRGLIHQTPGELSLHCTLQGLCQSPVSCYVVPPAHTVSPFQPKTAVLFLLPLSVFTLFLWRTEYRGQRGNRPGRCRWHFHPSHKTHFKRFVWDTDVKNPPFVHMKSLTHGENFRYKILYAKGVKKFFDNIKSSINLTPVVRMLHLHLQSPCIL